MDLDAFRDLYGEFSSAPDTIVQAQLDFEVLNVSDSWGVRSDHIHGLRTAAALARSPVGRNARKSKAGTSEYDDELRRLSEGHAFARNRIN